MSDLTKIKYTVYLIKEEYTEFEDVLDGEKYDQVVELREGLDLNGKVFIGHNDSSEPSWYSELKEGLTDPPSLNNQSTRLVLLVKRSRRIFAFVFGHGKHMLKPESYERGFGFKVVLNNCEVSKLKSIDSSTIDTVTVQSRTQTSKSSDIYEFNIDDTRDLLKSVTAEARDFNRYGKVIAGRDPFHFYYDFSFATLKDLCDRVLEDSQSTRYKQHFEWIDYLSEIKDPILINSLNTGLVHKINECYRSGINDESIHLAPPEIINMEDNLVYSYLPTGNKEDELSLASYIGSKKPKGDNDYSLKKLKSDKVLVYNSSTQELVDRWPVYNCLIGEVEYEENYFILTLGQWYLINKEYLNQINAYLENLEEINLDMIECDSSTLKTENDYNIAAAENHESLLCMDRINIVIDNARFELCDLLSLEKHLIHVKPWSSSSTLSHLFSQGRISAETLVNFPEEVLPTIRTKIKENQGENDEFENVFASNVFNPRDYTIVYAIIYEGEKEIHDRIPFFSKLNFVHNVKTLRRMQFNVQKAHIKKK